MKIYQTCLSWFSSPGSTAWPPHSTSVSFRTLPKQKDKSLGTFLWSIQQCPFSILRGLTAESRRKESLNTKKSTFEGVYVSSDLQYFLKWDFEHFFGLSDIYIGEIGSAPIYEFLTFFSVFPLIHDLQIKVPNVEIEDDQTFVVGIVFRISGGKKVIEADLPVDLLVFQGEFITDFDFFEVLPNGNVGDQSVDIIFGWL